MPEHCANCGRFVGKDALEGVDWSQGSMDIATGDWPYTGLLYCAPNRGCTPSLGVVRGRPSMLIEVWNEQEGTENVMVYQEGETRAFTRRPLTLEHKATLYAASMHLDKAARKIP